MVQFQVLYWRDIPVQIKVFAGRRPISAQLPEDFQTAIDRIAMQEGLTGTDAYLDQWQWTKKTERSGEAQQVLAELLAELEIEGRERINAQIEKRQSTK